MCDFGIFDQAQVQDRESSHYGLWQISIGSNDKPLYNTAKQHPSQHKYTLDFRKLSGLNFSKQLSYPHCTVIPTPLTLLGVKT